MYERLNQFLGEAPPEHALVTLHPGFGIPKTCAVYIWDEIAQSGARFALANIRPVQWEVDAEITLERKSVIAASRPK